MYVIIHGNRHFRCSCDDCKAVLEYDLTDIRIKRQGRGKILYIDCPECGYRIKLDIKKLTKDDMTFIERNSKKGDSVNV